MGRLVMGSEGPMGKLVYVGIVNEKTVTIRNSPINAALAVDAYIKEMSDLSKMQYSIMEAAEEMGHTVDTSGTDPRWVIQIWDTTAMGATRLEPVGHVYGVGKPTISSVRKLHETADDYMKSLG